MDSTSSRWRKAKRRPTNKSKKAKSANARRQELRHEASEKLNPPISFDEPQPGPSGMQIDNVSKESTSTSHRPPTASTATGKRKLETFASTLSSEPGEPHENYLFVHSSTWQELFKNLACGECGKKDLTIQMRERRGFAARLCVKCGNCGHLSGHSYTSPRTIDKSKRPPFDVNRRMVEAFSDTGGGHAQMEKFGMTMGMSVMASRTYFSHLAQLSAESSPLKREILTKARKAVRAAHVAVNPQLVSEDIINIAVSYDGTWHKRGHTSLYGIGAVIDILTGLVIDFEVLSKFCHMCSLTATSLGADSPEYAIWKEGHKSNGECHINHEGSSNSMEIAAADRIWKRSITESKMRYTSMLSDGDAKTFAHLQKEAVYGPDWPIEKEECLNHVAKRLGTGLRNLVKTYKAQGVTMGGRAKGSLKETTIVALTNFYRSAITKNIPDVSKMKTAIFATLTHCQSTDDNPQHDDCPPGVDSWCFYQKKLAKGEPLDGHDNMPVKLAPGIVDKLRPLYERLANNELLTRCARGKTQNANESLHATIWRKCPKDVFVSKNRIDTAAVNAIAEFNMGCAMSYRSKRVTRDERKLANSMKIMQQRDARRKRKSEWQSTARSKKLRRMVKTTKTALQALAIKKEGETYGAGRF